ncbi:nucleoside recognition domain-containing protein [Dysgonomonas sp. 520]|uniref:nucleoside recognition domain-containing protein n=1 Tax=Dysgonomonas sp. 520 TaxID=2302931 RepID=UPI0013D419DE|nr:nucleoside recognition domain-containing protein [Dysgonomonas sp. 520]NDW10844.1 hypothetical protein [Dysgonomonas sp. 520]
MVLNYIWVGFILVAFVVAVAKLIFLQDYDTIIKVVNSTFGSAKTGFEVSLALTGVLALWMGLMKIGENGGMIKLFSRAIYPLFKRLFPEIPKDHPASGSMLMNISANMLGLDNAATPAGLKAMQELQEINPDKSKASNSMIMFLVMNASGLTIVPVSVMAIRAQAGAANPADVFIPILIATFVATLVGVLAVCIKQGINIFDKVILGTFGGIAALIAGVMFLFQNMSTKQVELASNFGASFILLTIIVLFVVSGIRKKINVYDSFIEGAKDGFAVAVKIIPFLIAILVAVGMFRESGAMGYLLDGLKYGVSALNFDTRWVDAMPTAIMKPLSGSGARGMMVEAIRTFDVDSFAARLSGVFQGATDTTFYIAAVYFGAVNIKNGRYMIPYALLADLAGVIAAIFVAYMFFG